MSNSYQFSGRILPKVLRRAHGIPEPSIEKYIHSGLWGSAEEIEETLAETSHALHEIQRQIQRGEETYFEETTSHANIFKGWDAFLDVRLEAPAAVSQVRRMPADYKWMSCSSVRIPQFFALPSVGLESALEKKRENASDKKEAEKVSDEEKEGEEVDATIEPKSVTKSDLKDDASMNDVSTPTLKRKERSQEDTGSQKEEPTPTPRRTKRSKRSKG